MILPDGVRTIPGTNTYTEELMAIMSLTFTHHIKNKQIKKRVKVRVKTFSNGSVIFSVRKCLRNRGLKLKKDHEKNHQNEYIRTKLCVE